MLVPTLHMLLQVLLPLGLVRAMGTLELRSFAAQMAQMTVQVLPRAVRGRAVRAAEELFRYQWINQPDSLYGA